VTSLFGRLPGWVRIPLTAALVALGVWWTASILMKVDPWSWEIVLGAALGALAAWQFRWRAKAVWEKRLLMGAVLAFALAMIVAHVRGLDHGNTPFFLFSVLLVSLPYSRAMGHEELEAARNEAEKAELAKKDAEEEDLLGGDEGKHR
jgi:hypothetical protein